MGRYLIKFSYFGTQYRGLQKNVPQCNVHIYDTDTIQAALECAFLGLIPKCKNVPRITLSSRTDCGVHSLCNAAHVDLINKYNAIYNPTQVLKVVNLYLHKCNHDIRLLEFIPVTQDFHARLCAKSRTYTYRFLTPKNNEHKLPLAEIKYSYVFRVNNLDIEKIRSGMKLFMGLKDFTTFSAKKSTDQPIKFVRELNSLFIEKASPLMPHDPLSEHFEYWHITFSSKGFLYKQVRRIVSTLLALGENKITERDIKIMLQVPGHHNWRLEIPVVPSHGLYLVNVKYCQEELDKYIIKSELLPNHEVVNMVDVN